MPKAPTKEEFFIRTGTIVSADRIVLLAGHKKLDADNVGNTFIFGWKRAGDWSCIVKNWGAGSLCVASEPDSQIVVLGADRQILAWGSDGNFFEGQFSGRGVGSSITAIGGRPYIVGMRGLVYRRTASDVWEAMDLGIPKDRNLEAAAGLSEDHFYVVGWAGQIYRVLRKIAHGIDTPTNTILTSVCTSNDGKIYCCGRKGVLIRGHQDQWEVIDHGVTEEDFWSILVFQRKLYVSSSTFIYRFEKGGLVRVEFGDEIPKSAYHLSAIGDQYLLSVGSQDVMLFDGVRWTRIL